MVGYVDLRTLKRWYLLGAGESTGGILCWVATTAVWLTGDDQWSLGLWRRTDGWRWEVSRSGNKLDERFGDRFSWYGGRRGRSSRDGWIVLR